MYTGYKENAVPNKPDIFVTNQSRYLPSTISTLTRSNKTTGYQARTDGIVMKHSSTEDEPNTILKVSGSWTH